jgi:hypothetical protein
LLITCDRSVIYSGFRHDIAEILLKVGLKQNNPDPLCFHDNCNQNLWGPLISGVTLIRYAQSQYIWKPLGAWTRKSKSAKVICDWWRHIYTSGVQSHVCVLWSLCWHLDVVLSVLLFLLSVSSVCSDISSDLGNLCIRLTPI